MFQPKSRQQADKTETPAEGEGNGPENRRVLIIGTPGPSLAGLDRGVASELPGNWNGSPLRRSDFEIVAVPALEPGPVYVGIDPGSDDQTVVVVGERDTEGRPVLRVSFAGDCPVKKICVSCRSAKPLEAFHRHRLRPHGRDNKCKACKAPERAERYRADPQKEIAATYVWKKANRERAKVQRLRDYSRRATAAFGPDGVPCPGDAGDLTADEWEEVIGFYLVITSRTRIRYQCAYCGAKKKRVDLTIDHVVPLSRGGRNTKSNVVPACGPCNSGKQHRDRWPTLPSPHLADGAAIELREVPDEALEFP